MNIQPRQLAYSLAVITLICVPIFFFVISAQPTAELNYLDNPWYLNRARLIEQGVLPDLFVYALAYPILVSLFDVLLRDVLLAGMLTNALLLWLILAGVYILGHWLYGSRRVAWLAVLLVATNVSMFGTMRLFWASLPFAAAVIGCIAACLFTIRRPGYASAALLGVLIALALYTRVEGIFYGILIPIAAAVVYRQSGNRGLAVRILLTSGLTLALLSVPFALNFLQVRAALDSTRSDAVTGIFTLLDRTPVEWEVIWRRVTDTLTGFLYHWSTLAWLVGLAGLIWVSARYRAAQWLTAALIGFNVLYTFVLAIWPYPIHIVFYVPLYALVLAASLDQLIRRGAVGRLAALALCALLILPGITTTAALVAAEPPLAYRASESRQQGAALDAWLQAQGWEGTRIYTFCNEITSFSRAHLQILYRLQFTTGWDAPERLIPQMREQGALLMTCGNRVPLDDWRALLESAAPAGLREVARFDRFIFFQPDES